MLKKIKWALRRYHVNIPRNALVLEVGSGGNPYPRSNVLVDAYEETRERHWDTLVHDRPTVLSFGENLPFKDKVFDYVIAAHVLEHTPHPEKFLSELQRVACAGYIETPDAFMERINPYKDHRLEVTVRASRLVIQKKSRWDLDGDLVELYEQRAKTIITRETIPKHASDFHVQYRWKDKIDFTVKNPAVNADWTPPLSDSKKPKKLSLKETIRQKVLGLFRFCLSQNFRNENLNIVPLMRCPNCFSSVVENQLHNCIECTKCASQFKFSKNIFFIGQQSQ